MAVTASAQDNGLNEWLPPSHDVTASDWMSDRGKYFCELGSNFGFYAGRLFGNGVSDEWTKTSVGLKHCKNLLALPSVIKGTMSFYEHLKKGGELKRNLIGEACYIFSDTLDTIQGYAGLMGSSIPAVFKTHLKDLAGIFGLSNTVYNLTLDMQKLRHIDVTRNMHPTIKDAKKAVEMRQHIVDSEISNKWYDRLRCVCSIVQCTLALSGWTLFKMGLIATATPVPPLLFAVISSVSLYGKYSMYAGKVHGNFWQTRYAELLPTAQTPKKAPKAV